MSRNFSIEEMNEHYRKRHDLRKGIFGKPYANYGYWPRKGMTIDEACDALTDLMGKEAGIGPSDEILEVGCGYGATTVYLAKTFKPRRIVGIDVTDIRVQTGQQLIKDNNLEERVVIEFGDACHLKYVSHSFTKLIGIECAFHFNTRYDFFCEASRVLKPEGILVLTDIVPSPEINLSNYSFDQIRDFLSADAKRYSDDNIYSIETYEKLLRDAGFSAVRIYSIKNKVILQFADHLEAVAQISPPDAKARRLGDCNRSIGATNNSSAFCSWIASGNESGLQRFYASDFVLSTRHRKRDFRSVVEQSHCSFFG